MPPKHDDVLLARVLQIRMQHAPDAIGVRKHGVGVVPTRMYDDAGDGVRKGERDAVVDGRRKTTNEKRRERYVTGGRSISNALSFILAFYRSQRPGH